MNLEAVDVVDDKNQRVISTRWVITEKTYPDGSVKPKARLVVRGFEEEEEVQVDAPTAAKMTLRTVLSIAANRQWSVKQSTLKLLSFKDVQSKEKFTLYLLKKPT